MRVRNAVNGICMCLAALCVVFSSCTSAKLSRADAAYDRGDWHEAQKEYRSLYNKLTKPRDRQLRGRVAFRLGVSLSKLNQAPKAAAAFRNAIRNEYADSTALYLLGRSLQADGKYQQAIDAYIDYLQLTDKGESTDSLGLSLIDQPRREGLAALAEEGIRGCRLAISRDKRPDTRYVVKPMRIFQTRRSEFSPMYIDGQLDQLYLTTTSEKASGEKKSPVTGMKNADIFVARKNEHGVWQRPEPAEGEINSADDEGIVAFSPDGQTMYLTRSRSSMDADDKVDIYTSRRTDASWSAPQPMMLTSDSTSVAGHPSVSPDGQWLYFTSDMPGGFGGLDIWRINLKERGNAQNLGPQINTPGNESFPYVRSDSLLYFSSDGHPGFGGLDIFKARLNTTGDFWSVDNMGTPLNSQADDFGITFGTGESGFFSSGRGDARGHDHIYSFELPDIHVTISGWVLDKDEEPVPNAIIRIVGDDGSNQKEYARSDGSFRFNLDRGVRYVMKAGAPGYLNRKQEFTSDSAEEDADYGVDFILTALNKPQVVENIFFDFDKATLRPESREALDELILMMQENPNITIELGAHTDRKGSDEYNRNLSLRRARSVTDYLEKAGIAADRLSPEGYGESTPKTVTRRINRLYPQFPEGTVLTEDYIETLSPEDQAAADQINRRTEFRILSIDYGLY